MCRLRIIRRLLRRIRVPREGPSLMICARKRHPPIQIVQTSRKRCGLPLVFKLFRFSGCSVFSSRNFPKSSHSPILGITGNPSCLSTKQLLSLGSCAADPSRGFIYTSRSCSILILHLAQHRTTRANFKMAPRPDDPKPRHGILQRL